LYQKGNPIIKKGPVNLFYMVSFRTYFAVTGIFFALSFELAAQTGQHRSDIRLMFYNLENMFDTEDNPDTKDDEFLPLGVKKWDSYRYWKKLKHIFQVIVAVGGTIPPEIIGFCEVEGYQPLYDLISNTPLMKYPYSIVHFDSPDLRGIDVALLVRSDKIRVLEAKPLSITFKTNNSKKTRDILYAELLIATDTLHIYVNHWPSRRGGQSISEVYREEVAGRLLANIDSLMQANPFANIVVMGDFNDEPRDRSLQSLKGGSLRNLSEKLQSTCQCGSYKYRNEWNMFDQILVSPQLLGQEPLCIVPGSLTVFRAGFLLVADEKFGGEKPIKTYSGPRYIGGFSDHLPVYVDFFLPKDY
jgi:endonuclease/exonuclease/phosphatase family metal-dependent hydrolase